MSNTEQVTYQDLVTRFGDLMAFDLLLIIEKLVPTAAANYSLDEEVRLQKALDGLNAIDFASEAEGTDICCLERHLLRAEPVI